MLVLLQKLHVLRTRAGLLMYRFLLNILIGCILKGNVSGIIPKRHCWTYVHIDVTVPVVVTVTGFYYVLKQGVHI